MKSKVSILLSVYRPNAEFLRQQLESLNAQTYETLELIVWNDCPDVPLDETLFASCITSFPYRLIDEHVNLGYAKAFEKLASLADGEYVSFCDQDDIWEPEKIRLCVEALEENDAVVAVCDVVTMDEHSEVHPEQKLPTANWACSTWSTGDDIAARAVFTCYAPGMAILARTDAVQKYIPFPVDAPHDRWLMAVLSAHGKAVHVKQQLVRYRRYGKNVTGTLNNVECKADYYRLRSDNSVVVEAFAAHFPDHPDIQEIRACNAARISGNPFRIFKHRRLVPDVYRYETLLAFCPDFLFRFLKKILF